MQRARERVEVERAERMLGDLKLAGLKMTKQRAAIVRAFASAHDHPTAQELFDGLRPAFPQMSFATVYNTLDALAQAGLCRTLRLGKVARFDPHMEAHHHALCEQCGHIADIPAASLDAPPGAARRVRRRVPGFVVRSVERIYRGVCAKCCD